jgi:hypothetical protein
MEIKVCCDIKNGCVTSKHKTSLDDFSSKNQQKKEKIINFQGCCARKNSK